MEENTKTTISKNKEGYGYKYTDLAQIHEYLESNNMKYYQYVDRIDNDDYIMTVPIIDGKEQPARRGVKIVDAVLNGIKNPAQEQGSATTYARRYSLLMAFGLATEDDDAASLTTMLVNTKEEAEKYVITFGKYNGSTLSEVVKDKKYCNWLLENAKDENVVKGITLLTGARVLTDEEKEEVLALTTEMQNLVMTKTVDYDALLKHYGVSTNKDMTLEQLRDAVNILREK